MIVVSDMMGTLTTGSPVLGLVDWVRRRQSRLQANWYMAAMLPGYFLARRGWIDWQRWGQNLMVDSLKLVHAASPEKLEDVAQWVVEYDLWPKRRADVIARLADHAAAGAEVYVVSSVVQPIATAFAARFGAKAIGTPLAFAGGRVRLAADLVASERKLDELFARLGRTRVEAAYGDTLLDVPLLEHASHPVAVYPDARLRALAEARGWEIIGSTTSYP